MPSALIIWGVWRSAAWPSGPVGPVPSGCMAWQGTGACCCGGAPVDWPHPCVGSPCPPACLPACSLVEDGIDPSTRMRVIPMAVSRARLLHGRLDDPPAWEPDGRAATICLVLYCQALRCAAPWQPLAGRLHETPAACARLGAIQCRVNAQRPFWVKTGLPVLRASCMLLARPQHHHHHQHQMQPQQAAPTPKTA